MCGNKINVDKQTRKELCIFSFAIKQAAAKSKGLDYEIWIFSDKGELFTPKVILNADSKGLASLNDFRQRLLRD